MNKRLRALCKSLKKDPVPEPSEQVDEPSKKDESQDNLERQKQMMTSYLSTTKQEIPIVPVAAVNPEPVMRLPPTEFNILAGSKSKKWSAEWYDPPLTGKESKRAKKEVAKWIEEYQNKLKSRTQTLIPSEWAYPCLFRNSRLNMAKKEELWGTVKKWEDEVGYLRKDIDSISKELIKVRKKRVNQWAQSLINNLDLKISGRMYEIYFINNPKELKKKNAKMEESASAQQSQPSIPPQSPWSPQSPNTPISPK